jgi:hypothetical protein
LGSEIALISEGDRKRIAGPLSGVHPLGAAFLFTVNFLQIGTDES